MPLLSGEESPQVSGVGCRVSGGETRGCRFRGERGYWLLRAGWSMMSAATRSVLQQAGRYGGWKRIWPGMARSAGAGWFRIDSAMRLAKFLAEPKVLHSEVIRLPCRIS